MFLLTADFLKSGSHGENIDADAMFLVNSASTVAK